MSDADFCRSRWSGPLLGRLLFVAPAPPANPWKRYGVLRKFLGNSKASHETFEKASSMFSTISYLVLGRIRNFPHACMNELLLQTPSQSRTGRLVSPQGTPSPTRRGSSAAAHPGPWPRNLTAGTCRVFRFRVPLFCFSPCLLCLRSVADVSSLTVSGCRLRSRRLPWDPDRWRAGDILDSAAGFGGCHRRASTGRISAVGPAPSRHPRAASFRNMFGPFSGVPRGRRGLLYTGSRATPLG